MFLSWGMMVRDWVLTNEYAKELSVWAFCWELREERKCWVFVILIMYQHPPLLDTFAGLGSELVEIRCISFVFTFPIRNRHRLSISFGAFFVRKSAGISFVSIICVEIWCERIKSRMKWCLISICLERLFVADSWDRNTAPLLSLKMLRGGKEIGDVGMGVWVRCDIILRNHKQCFAQSPSAMYSASVVERATVGCRRLFQLISDPPNVNTYPVVDLRVVVQAA
jgi:hypothetical protein